MSGLALPALVLIGAGLMLLVGARPRPEHARPVVWTARGRRLIRGWSLLVVCGLGVITAWVIALAVNALLAFEAAGPLLGP